jgi:hypothetical protein
MLKYLGREYWLHEKITFHLGADCIRIEAGRIRVSFLPQKENPPDFWVVFARFNLATNCLVGYRPRRSRTCDTLIKSYVVKFQDFGNFLRLEPAGIY